MKMIDHFPDKTTANKTTKKNKTMKTKLHYLMAIVAVGSSAYAGELALVIDTSGSMAGSRIDEAKTAAKAVIDKLDSSTFLSIRRYDGCNTKRIFDMVPMTSSNQSAAKSIVDGLVATGLTPISKSLQDAQADFLRKSTPRVTLLLTDGEETCDSGADLAAIAKQALSSSNIKTFIVGYQLSSTTATTFENVAKSGGGKYIDAKANDLAQSLIAAVNQSGVGGGKKVIALQVSGNSTVARNKTGTYKARVIYSDGSSEDVTSKTVWDALPVDFAKQKRNKVKVDRVIRFWVTGAYGNVFGGYRVNVK